MNKMLALLAVAAALCLSAGSVQAQDDNGGGGGGGGGGRRGFGGGNFDPAQMQQQRLDRARENLGFTNDTDWSAVEPLVTKVMDAQREQMAGRFRGMRRNRGGGDNGGGPGGGFQPPTDAARDALQSAVDSGAPAAQIKAALDKYRTSEKAKQDKLEQAQSDLKKVLNQKQEASAVLMGLLN